MKKKNLFNAVIFTVALIAGSSVFAQSKMTKEATKMVGGAAMYPSKNIVENAVNSKDHTTLVAAVTAAGLVEILQSDGPFTVFAPVNKAFEALPDGTVETLLLPENKQALQGVLTYHVLSRKFSAADIVAAIKKGKGTATFVTVSGGKLMAKINKGKVQLVDENGGIATVTIADVNQSNGVIHVIDAIVLPKS